MDQKGRLLFLASLPSDCYVGAAGVLQEMFRFSPNTYFRDGQ